MSNVSTGSYNVFVMIRPAQIWNSDLMQELLDEISDETIDKINADWVDTFGMRVDENTFLLGAMDLPKSITANSRVRDAIMLGGGPATDEGVRKFCSLMFKPDDYIERDHEGNTYFVLDPPRDEYSFAYTTTEGVGIIGLEKSVTASLDVLSGKKDNFLGTKAYAKNSRLIIEDADMTALVWDVDRILEMGTAFLRMQQEDNVSAETAEAINSLEAMGVSVEFTHDLILTFRCRYENAEAAETVGEFIGETLENLKQEDSLRDLMILFKGAAEEEGDLLEIIEATSYETDGSALLMRQTIPGDSPILANLRDAFFGAAEAEDAADVQLNTIQNIERLGLSIEQYILDHGFSPKTGDIEELQSIMRALEINSVYTDGWGNLLVYEPDMTAGSKSYEIRSYGSDGQPGPEVERPGLTDKPEEDYIYGNGHWIQRHEGPVRNQ